MNILFVTKAHLSIPSAEATDVLGLANKFAEMGHNVHLVALSVGAMKLHKNITFHKISAVINKRFLSIASLTIQRFHLRYLIRKIIHDCDIDIIYERFFEDDPEYPEGVPCIMDVKWIASEPMLYGDASEKEFLQTKKRCVKKLKKAHKIIVPSKHVEEFYTQAGVNQDKFVILPVSIDVNKFKPLDQEDCRNKLGFNNSPIVMFVGAFRKYQGLEYAISSLPNIKSVLPNVKLVLVGDAGEYQGFKFRPTIDELKLLAREVKVEENVIFTGLIPPEKVPLYLNAADVCIVNLFSSKMEYYPWKLYEYMACAKPVVASRVRGLEFLEEIDAGILVDINKIDVMAEAAVKLLLDKPMATRLGENGRKYVVEHANLAIKVEKIEKLMELLRRKR